MVNVDDTLVATFVSIVNCAPNEARAILESCNGNIDQAISLTLDQNDEMHKRPQTSQSFSSGSGNMKRLRPTNGMTSATSMPSQSRSKQRRLDDGESVRAPLPQRQERLLDVNNDVMRRSGLFLNSRQRFLSVREQVPRTRSRRRRREQSAKERENSNEAEWSPHLRKMFRPPVDILFGGTFADACEHAEKEKKWLLVNVQSKEEFMSFRLNRDTWSVPMVKTFVRQHFVFVQFQHDSADGRVFCRYYHQRRFPHIAILDPRTRQKLDDVVGFVQPLELLKMLETFVDRQSNNDNNNGATAQQQQQPPPPPQQQINASRAVVVSDLSYEEEYAAAIEASLLEASASKVKERDDEEECVVVAKDVERSFAERYPEPLTSDVDSTRLQVRLANNSSVIRRRFHKTDKVSTIYEWVKSEIPKEEAQNFMLQTTFPKRNLDQRDATLKDANVLDSALVMVHSW